MKTCNLNFDTVKMDTKLAEDFLKSNSSFKPLLQFDYSEEYVLDSYGNKIYHSKIFLQARHMKYNPVVKHSKREEKQAIFFKLAKKLEENIELFCQLDYLIRSIPPIHVKNFDLKLIIQNVLLFSSNSGMKEYKVDDTLQASEIIITDDSPLFLLGCVAQLVFYNGHATIYCTKQTAVVGWLFTHLCHSVGLGDQVSWSLIPENIVQSDQMQSAIQFTKIKAFRSGCCGIVTGISDVDSAVDTFLGSTDKDPWKLKRILVQENILKRFLIVLKGKAKGSEREYVYEDKTFVFENIGQENSNIIVIEAYRTVKELLSLVKVNQPFCVSLWSSDVSESNEISTNVNSNIIWINDFGCFDGPPQSSQCLFSIIEESKYFTENRDLDKVRQEWLKLDITERAQKVHKILQVIDSNKANVLAKLDYNLESFYSVEKNCICCGVNSVPDVVFKFSGDVEHYLYLIQGFKFVGDIDLISTLQKIGAPVDYHKSAGKIQSNYPYVYYRTKTIWTSFGTIFAN